MPRLTTLIVVSLTLIFSLACATLLGTPETVATESETQPEMQMPPTPPHVYPLEDLTCPLITEKIIDINLSPFTEENVQVEEYLVTYTISNDELTDPYYESVSSDLEDERNDATKHEEIWNYFTALIPYTYRPHLVEFTIMTDGESNTLAAVAQTYDDPELWDLQVDIADVADDYYLTFTLIHEFAHLLTLGPNQVPPSLAVFNNPEDNDIYFNEVSACATYFPGEGCSNRNSYINQFYDRFWLDVYEEWNEINLEEDEDLYYEKLDDFYYKYEDQFLTDYAVTHPAEDIAESFGFFVFAEKPDGDTIAEQKILFFYEFPELVTIRTEILNNLCIAFPQ